MAVRRNQCRHGFPRTACEQDAVTFSGGAVSLSFINDASSAKATGVESGEDGPTVFAPDVYVALDTHEQSH